MIESDYVVKGCGASAMGFVDSMLHASDVTFTIVDRGPAPGGHWNFAYPFVRLHQPSDQYGVASRPFDDGSLDDRGPNAGLRRLPSGLQVADYYHRLMAEQFLPTGRVTYLPMTELHGDGQDGEVVSLLSGRRTRTHARIRFVDATHLEQR